MRLTLIRCLAVALTRFGEGKDRLGLKFQLNTLPKLLITPLPTRTKMGI